MTSATSELLIPVAQLLAIVIAAPLFGGLVGRLEARAAAGRGAPLLEPYRRLRKLLGKDELRPAESSRVYDGAPALAFAAVVAAAGLVPAVTTRAPLGASGGVVAFCGLLMLGRFAAALGALDTSNPILALALGRERALASLAEPALLLSLLAISLGSGTAELGGIAERAVAEGGTLLSPGRLLALAALALVVVAEGSVGRRIGADSLDPAASLLEHGGPRLAVLELTADLRRLSLFVLAVNLIAPWGIAAGGGAGPIALATALLAAKLVVAAALACLLAAGLGKTNRLASPEVLGAALTLATLALLFVVLGGEARP